MYQQVKLSDHTLVGISGPVPSNLLGLSDAILTDLSAAIQPAPPGFAGMAFWPVMMTTPSYDATQQVVVAPTSYTADPTAKIVTGAATVRAMTAAEFLVANPVSTPISDRQLYQQLALMGKITQTEALAYVRGGTLPAVISNYIASLPTSQQFGLNMLLMANSYNRDDPSVPAFGALFNLDSPALDAAWRAAFVL